MGLHRRDGAYQHHVARLFEQQGGLSHTALVFCAVVVGKTQVTAQAGAQCIAVEQKRGDARSQKLAFRSGSQSGLACAGETGEPHHKPLLASEGTALGFVHSACSGADIPSVVIFILQGFHNNSAPGLLIVVHNDKTGCGGQFIGGVKGCGGSKLECAHGHLVFLDPLPVLAVQV